MILVDFYNYLIINRNINNLKSGMEFVSGVGKYVCWRGAIGGAAGIQYAA
jgi:hypothetical protein